MKEPIIVELTAREALAVLSVLTMARHDLRDSRPEVATAEAKTTAAIQKATER